MRPFLKQNQKIFTLGIAAGILSCLGVVAFKKRRDNQAEGNMFTIISRLRSSGMPARFVFMPQAEKMEEPVPGYI